MAKAQRRGQVMKRQARQVKGAAVRAGRRAAQVHVTLGDLVAAAFDAVGGEARKVARVLSSPDMAVATGKHIVFVG